jgi:hypothetical protein
MMPSNPVQVTGGNQRSCCETCMLCLGACACLACLCECGSCLCQGLTN